MGVGIMGISMAVRIAEAGRSRGTGMQQGRAPVLGDAVAQNNEPGLPWLESAAAAGCSSAQRILGELENVQGKSVRGQCPVGSAEFGGQGTLS